MCDHRMLFCARAKSPLKARWLDIALRMSALPRPKGPALDALLDEYFELTEEIDREIEREAARTGAKASAETSPAPVQSPPPPLPAPEPAPKSYGDMKPAERAAFARRDPAGFARARDAWLGHTPKPKPAASASTTALTWNGKRYRDLKPAQRAELKRENLELFNAMRAEPAWKGRTYGELRPSERVALKRAEPELFERMRAAWQAGEP
ncbi:MAG: hypothetical protein IPM35_02605 [Myxococcales bacterium]|nr:hypothetical protein [Myxococcales bacterium]